MSADINKENLDTILNDLAKQYRKYGGKNQKAELILVGGAAVIARYNFRDSTKDIDAIIKSASALKDAAVVVGEKYDLEYQWLNSDFTKTCSYSKKLNEYSKYYKTFANVLEVRVIESEYLVAMKMVSAREYKNDLSDIVGIIESHHKNGNDLCMEKINNAVNAIYGSQNMIPQNTWEFVDHALKYAANERYSDVRKDEVRSNKLLKEFQKEYKDVLTQDNVNEILETLRQKDRKEAEIDYSDEYEY